MSTMTRFSCSDWERSHLVRYRLHGVLLLLLAAGFAGCGAETEAATAEPAVETVALWLFDEPVGLYPSSTLDDSSGNDMPMAIGMGGQIVEGLYGNALLLSNREPLEIPEGEEKFEEFGFVRMQPDAGRKTPPLSWHNA